MVSAHLCTLTTVPAVLDHTSLVFGKRPDFALHHYGVGTLIYSIFKEEKEKRKGTQQRDGNKPDKNLVSFCADTIN